MVEHINLESLAAAANHANSVAKGKERTAITREVNPPSWKKMIFGPGSGRGSSRPSVNSSTDSDGQPYKYSEYTSIIREVLYKGMGMTVFPGDNEYIYKLRQSRDLSKSISCIDMDVYNPIVGGPLAALGITADHWLNRKSIAGPRIGASQAIASGSSDMELLPAPPLIP
jgi:hypothetical protein